MCNDFRSLVLSQLVGDIVLDVLASLRDGVWFSVASTGNVHVWFNVKAVPKIPTRELFYIVKERLAARGIVLEDDELTSILMYVLRKLLKKRLISIKYQG